MADISVYLAQILSAVYGEDVRGSIHDAIEIINDVGEVVFSTGTIVDSSTSSSTGFYDSSLYLNTNTYELWKCVGVDTWQSLGILKGDPGDPGEDGNRWYRGTGISGKAVNPTVYSGSGITEANPNDFYLNPSEGAVYYCVTGGDASTATWSYDFTMTGGGGGGDTVAWNQIQQSTGATKIATITINGTPIDVYAPSGGGSSTFAGLDDTDISNIQADQIVQYKSVGGQLKLQNVEMPQGTLTISQNGTTKGTFTANQSTDTSASIVTDEWTAEQTLTPGDTTATFSGLNTSYAYKPFIQVADGETAPTGTMTFSGTTATVTFTAITSAQASGGAAKIKLRIIK